VYYKRLAGRELSQDTCNHDAIEAVTFQPPRGFEMIFIDSKTTTQEDKYTMNVSSTNATNIWATSMQYGPVGSNFHSPPKQIYYGWPLCQTLVYYKNNIHIM
jgi:hypothetical protein